MPAKPTVSLDTSGTDPKTTTKQILEAEIQRVVDAGWEHAIDIGTLNTADTYPSVAAGIAAVPDGGYFRTRSADGLGLFDYHQRSGASSILIGTAPSLAGSESILGQTEAARDGSFFNARAAATLTDARALVADGQTFLVAAPGAKEVIAYRRLTSTTQTELARYPTVVDATEGKILNPPPRPQWSDRFQTTETGNGVSGTPFASAAVVTDADMGPSLEVTGQGTVASRYCQRVEPGRIYKVRWKIRRSTPPTNAATHPVTLRVRGLTDTFTAVAGAAASITVQAIQIADTTVVDRSFTFSKDHPQADFIFAPTVTQFRAGFLTAAGDNGVTRCAVCEITDVTDEYTFAGGPDTYITPPNTSRAVARRALPTSAISQGVPDEGSVWARLSALEIEVAGLRRNRAAIYVDPAASGAGDGSSWANAMTSLKAALEAADPGDIVYSNASESEPFSIEAAAAIANAVTWCSNEGPDGETWISGATYLTWTAHGGNIFSAAEATEPLGVAYDFKRDTTNGAVTGVDLTQPAFARALAAWRKDPADCVAWYGFLEKETVPTTTPAEGRWSYTGGRIYINPPGTPVLASVNALAIVGRAYSAGIFLANKSGAYLENFRHYGRLITHFTLNDGGANGYGLRSSVAKDCVIEDVISIASGNHAVGLSGSSGPGNIYRNCIATGGCESSNPFVWRGNQPFPDAEHKGDGLVYISMPYMRHDGRPLPAAWESWTANIAYSHGAGNVGDMGGLLYTGLLQINPMALVAAKHGGTYSDAARSVFVNGGDQPAIDPDNPLSFSVVCSKSLHVGPGGGPTPNVRYIDCEFDCLDGSQGQFPFNTAGGPWYIRMERCKWTLDLKSAAKFTNLVNAGRIALIDCEIIIKEGNGTALIQLGTGPTGKRLELRGNTFRSPDGPAALLRTQNSGAMDWRTNAIVDSLGGNVFEEGFDPVISAAATFGRNDWTTGADHDEADVLFG